MASDIHEHVIDWYKLIGLLAIGIKLSSAILSWPISYGIQNNLCMVAMVIMVTTMPHPRALLCMDLGWLPTIIRLLPCINYISLCEYNNQFVGWFEIHTIMLRYEPCWSYPNINFSLPPYSVVKRNFKELRPLGTLDPLFLPLFTLICPEKELPELFLHIPLYLSAAFTLLLLRDATFSDSEVIKIHLTHLLWRHIITFVKCTYHAMHISSTSV